MPVHPSALSPLLAALLLFTGGAGAQTPSPAPLDMAYAHEMKGRMLMGMHGVQKLQLTGNMDKDFALLMREHHQQAIHMAEMQIAHGRAPAMRAMARQIRAVQKAEIAKFDGWLAQQP